MNPPSLIASLVTSRMTIKQTKGTESTSPARSFWWSFSVKWHIFQLVIIHVFVGFWGSEVTGRFVYRRVPCMYICVRTNRKRQNLYYGGRGIYCYSLKSMPEKYSWKCCGSLHKWLEFGLKIVCREWICAVSPDCTYPNSCNTWTRPTRDKSDVAAK